MPGGAFVAQAKFYGDNTSFVGKGKGLALEQAGHQLATLYFQALYDKNFLLSVPLGSQCVPCKFLPGSLASQAMAHCSQAGVVDDLHSCVGPTSCPVMLIGKWPSRDEVGAGINMVGDAYENVWDILEDFGVTTTMAARWYTTNLVKFANPDPQGGSKFPKQWVTECLPLLHQELRLVRPKFILCFGADVSRLVTASSPECPNGLGEEQMRGRVVQIKYPIHVQGEEPEYNVARVMSVMHPAKVQHAPELREDLRRGLADFLKLTQGKDVGGEEVGLDHRVVDNVEELRAIVDSMLATQDPYERIIAVDAEWHGERPFDANSYLRTVQFSNRAKFAVCVKLRHPGGAEAFQPNINAAAEELKRLFLHPESRIGGHFFRSDIPWIRHHLGIDLRPKYAPSGSYETCLTEGGWETGLAEHALNEAGLLGLEVLRSKYTTAFPYEKLLDVWVAKYCATHGVERKDLEGFGDWDSDDFYTYACHDADVTYRVVRKLFELLPKDKYGIDCRRPYWIAHRASLAVLEMEESGMCISPERVMELSNTFTEVRNSLIDNMRILVNWASFNPNSDIHCRAILFGAQYGRKPVPAGWPDVYPLQTELQAEAITRVDKAIKAGEIQLNPDGQQRYAYLMPQDALVQNLTPIITTGDKPKAWEKVVASNETDKYQPSTCGEVLGILSYTNQPAAVLRDIRYLSKALQTVLRPPVVDKTTQEYMTDQDGGLVYDKGLLSNVCSDGKIHTRIKQTMETGRASSSKPNLQNLSNRREDDFKSILGHLTKDGEQKGRYLSWLNRPMYEYSQRTIFRASRGKILIESDYTGAELAGIMWMAQDVQGMEDVRCNLLPESDPNYRDIHSNMAVQAFNLNCRPTKQALKDIGKAGLRVAAKNIIFGVPYGRGAEAIARQCREEGVNITIEEAQKIIDYYFSRYPSVRAFLKECAGAVMNPGYMLGVFGRARRFAWTHDNVVRSGQEREAGNFRIQNLVADAVWCALANMYDYRACHNIDFTFILQIHDAIMVEAPFSEVGRVYRDVFPTCMNDQVEIWPCRADGIKLPLQKPYHLQGSRELMFRWGDDIQDLAKRHYGKDAPLVYEMLEQPEYDAQVAQILAELETVA